MTGSQKDDSRKGAKTQRKTQIRDIRRSSFGSNFVALRLCGKLCHRSTIREPQTLTQRPACSNYSKKITPRFRVGLDYCWSCLSFTARQSRLLTGPEQYPPPQLKPRLRSRPIPAVVFPLRNPAATTA